MSCQVGLQEVCVCVYTHSVLGCLISCWRFGAKGLLSLGEHFQWQEQKPALEGRMGCYV